MLIIFMIFKIDFTVNRKNANIVLLQAINQKFVLIKKDAKYVYAKIIILKNVNINKSVCIVMNQDIQKNNAKFSGLIIAHYVKETI